ncbi:hypothetical protein [Vibrio mediterranei]|uniref:hypothetical protein n=1 Tax=Vibrio mediterranei TaxID=689 RepID=UPI002283A0EB|nr:hypothetical protein [Vibrio mediterranei]MCY9855424.1 hypothetical protein [Vibrio mediterranei]
MNHFKERNSGAMVRRYVKGDDHPKEQKSKVNCSAHGCPLAGSVQEGGALWCTFHAGAKSERHQKITEAICSDMPLITQCFQLLALSPYEFTQQIAKFRALPGAFALREGESFWNYKERFRSELNKLVCG